jgi:hypothetical protein
MSLNGPSGDPACQNIGRFQWPFSLAHLRAAGPPHGGWGRERMGVHDEFMSPDRRLEAQSDELFVLGKVVGWSSELHAAAVATGHLEGHGPLEVAKVPKREGSRRRKQECRCVREAMPLPAQCSWVETARKTRGEERRPGMLVCAWEGAARGP